MSKVVKKFCADFKLPDLSPLVEQDLPTPGRYAVVWKVMQARITVEEQGVFLRRFCEGSGLPALVSFAGFLGCDLLKCNPGLCTTAMDVIPTMAGFDWDLMGVSMKEYCAANNLPGVVALIDKFGFESIVYSIDQVFPVDERMREALDHLKFKANPARFSTDLDRMIEQRNADFAAEMAALKLTLEGLKAEKAELHKQLGSDGSESPVIGGKRAFNS
jgi:hypothetical protein